MIQEAEGLIMQDSLFPCSLVSPALCLPLSSLRRSHPLCTFLLLLWLANPAAPPRPCQPACPVGGAPTNQPLLPLSLSLPAARSALRQKLEVQMGGGVRWRHLPVLCPPPPSRTCGLLRYDLWAPPPSHLSHGQRRPRAAGSDDLI